MRKAKRLAWSLKTDRLTRWCAVKCAVDTSFSISIIHTDNSNEVDGFVDCLTPFCRIFRVLSLKESGRNQVCLFQGVILKLPVAFVRRRNVKCDVLQARRSYEGKENVVNANFNFYSPNEKHCQNVFECMNVSFLCCNANIDWGWFDVKLQHEFRKGSLLQIRVFGRSTRGQVSGV